MKARKLPSGKWNVQVFDYIDENGKRIRKSITAETKEQAEYLASKYNLERSKDSHSGIVSDMVSRAIREKSAALSPSTLRGYKKVLENNIKPSPFGKIKLASIQTKDVQSWISWMLGKGYSPKSIKNALGVFTSCYQFYGGERVFRVKMPQASAKRKHVPSIADVKTVLNYFADDKDMTAAIRLCAFASLRRGEICALNAHDVDRKNKTIKVNKSITETPDGEWIVKPPKTASSVRVIPVSQFVLDALPKSGKVVNILPYIITNRFYKAIDALGVEHFTFHDLRHFYASLAHNKGVSDITIQANAGWSSAATMKSIYWGEISEETRAQANKLNDYIDSAF